ncbi:MAG: carboxypeptidase regulatory-like domain-containing protein [Acidobacteria bacterium]|nr:carboxypeptidase regulatory-like domain-containing protein [Acidobacteriota bacterium]
MQLTNMITFMLFAYLPVSAQTATATLKGLVTDSSEKVLPGAALTLTQNSTGLKRTFTADDGGHFTFTFLEPGNYSLGLAFNGAAMRPNVIADPIIASESDKKNTLTWFNTAAFQAPTTYQFGNAPRTFSNLRGPGYFGTNMSLQRNFKITESACLQFRAEAFNIFNRANFIIPVGVLGAANFGKLLAAEDPRQMQFALKLYF